MPLRSIVFLLFFFWPCYVAGKVPSAVDVAANIQKKYEGLFSFSVEVEFLTDMGAYKICYYQKGEDVRIRWKVRRDGKYVSILQSNFSKGMVPEGFPVLPFSLKDFTSPYKEWKTAGINTQKFSYEYITHLPCVVIGDINKVYIDIENFALRKKTINNVEYLFRNFVHIGNYFLPSNMDIKCNGHSYQGNIIWKHINKENSNLMEDTGKGGTSLKIDEPPLFKCLPTAKELFRESLF